ncbi:MAG: hypothetical protein V7637_3042 [Mycobacteriales bacterium]
MVFPGHGAPRREPVNGSPQRAVAPGARFKRPPVAAEAPAAVRAPRALLGLQRAAGNRAVGAFVAAATAPARRPAQVDPTPSASAAPGSSEAVTTGQPGTAQPVTIQRTLTNDADWNAVDPTTGQGTGVVAIVGPGYQYGSKPTTSPGFKPYDYTALFSAATVGAAYCQGHLLNDNLGGPGDSSHPKAVTNLTAFPQQPTNGDHKNLIEKQMKAAAKTAWFKYTVSIGYSTDSAPRLFHRLGGNPAPAAAAGIAPANATFGYASSLTATWTELVQSLAATNAAPLVKPLGVSGSLSLDIPSPLSFVAPAKQADEYPGGKGPTWSHLPAFKRSQTSNRAGVLPPTGGNAPPGMTRAHVLPQRWLGIDAARAGLPVGAGNAAFVAGHTHYGQGVAESKIGPADAARFGRGYKLGYKDFDEGIDHGRTNLLAAPPASPQAKIDGHGMFWAGVAKGKIQPLAVPPVGNRAEIAGHADFWEGVKHGRANPKATVPANLAQAESHNDYWAGVEHAYKNAAAAPPGASLAKDEGHKDHWDGVALARADPTSAAPPELGKAKGHTDVVDAVKHARANVRGTALANETVAQKAVLVEYWAGVDFAKANPAATPYAGPSALERHGVTDYREGADLAAKDLPSFGGAAPVGGGAVEGFQDYHAGADAHVGGAVADPARSANARGWADAAAGVIEGTAGTPPTRTDGGFAYGYLHAAGAATARAGKPADATGSPQALVAGMGHAGYLAGLAAARKDLGSAEPQKRTEAAGHKEFLAGVTHAKASIRTTPPAAGSVATTQAATEYWQGVDFAKLNAATVYGKESAAAKAGDTDYRDGADRAASGLAAMLGAAPAGGGAAEGFADYRDGVQGHQDGQADDATRAGYARGWTACADGLASGAASLGGLAPPRTDAGFHSGYLHAHGAVHARAGQPAPTPGPGDAVIAGGHAAYGSGLASARTDFTAAPPPGLVAARAHQEYSLGVAHGRANARGAAPAAGSEATTAGWTEYWRGVDLAKAQPWGTAYAGVNSAERAGAADYAAGANAAAASLVALNGAAPAAGGEREGFEHFRDGVEDCKAGNPAAGDRTAHAKGWQDCADGMTAGDATLGVPGPPARTDGGYESGYWHAHGGARARVGLGAPGPGGLNDAVAGAGHAAYLAGMATARGNLAAPAPQRVIEGRAHAEFLAGVVHARTNPRATAPAAGREATTAAWTEYWQGVDIARANPGVGYAGGNAAQAQGVTDYNAGVQHAVGQAAGAAPVHSGEAEGAADYWAGEAVAPTQHPAPMALTAAGRAAHADFWAGVAHARASLANFTGPAPAGRLSALGFAAYHSGATAGHNQLPNNAAQLAYALGWADDDAGYTDKRAGNPASQPHGGYLSSYQLTPPPVPKRVGDPTTNPHAGKNRRQDD